MTVGVYKLNFEDTDKVYIGQSINIEQRIKSHSTNLRRGITPSKLQEAYNIYGPPTMELLIECTVEELDDIEAEAIDIYNSVLNGFNTMSKYGHRSELQGDRCGNSKYSNDSIIEVFNLLVNSPELTHREIIEITGVSYAVVNSISRMQTHAWLEEEFPEEYKVLRSNFLTRRTSRRTAKSRGISYPSIISPEGIEYTIESIRGFAREHNLNSNALGRVLRGQAKSHAGWILKKI